MAENVITDESLAFLYKAAASRGPGKRQVRVVNRETLVANFGALGGVSDDEEDDDFKVEDESNNETDTDDDSQNDNDKSDDGSDNDGSSNGDSNSESGDDEDNESKDDKDVVDSTVNNTPDESNLEPAAASYSNSISDSSTSICCICLNVNHVGVEGTIFCDSCGLVVHESCYGIIELNSDDESESSSELTEPWFCEPCLAGLNPRSLISGQEVYCELCPVRGGAFKRTDEGRWVHLLCAYYNSQVTFGDVEKLTNVCLANLASSQYGSRSCALCTNKLTSRAGICVKCDAGMCKTYMHVTCGQRHGLLVDSLSSSTNGSDDLNDVINVADPYYLCCSAHSDRSSMKLKKFQYAKLEKQNVLYVPKQLSEREKQCLQTKSRRFASLLTSRPNGVALAATGADVAAATATEKQQRLMTSSYEFMTKMKRKSELCIGQSEEQWENEFRIGFSSDMIGKYVMPAAFSGDFVAYFIEREKFVRQMASQVNRLNAANAKLKIAQNSSKEKYDALDKDINVLAKRTDDNYESLVNLCTILKKFNCKNVKSPDPKPSAKTTALLLVEASPVKQKPKPAGVGGKGSSSLKLEINKSLAARKTVRRFEPQQTPVMVTNLECAICHKANDQHRLAHCDTCKLHYHLNCLDPPLTKMPRKTAMYGWECSTCSRQSSDSDEDEENVPDVNAPRQLRTSHKPVQRYRDENIAFHKLNSIRNAKFSKSMDKKKQQLMMTKNRLIKARPNRLLETKKLVTTSPSNSQPTKADDVIADVIQKAVDESLKKKKVALSNHTSEQRKNGVVLIKSGRQVIVKKRKPTSELVLSPYDSDVSSLKRAKLLQPGVGTALHGSSPVNRNKTSRKLAPLLGLDDESSDDGGQDELKQSQGSGCYDESKPAPSIKVEADGEDDDLRDLFDRVSRKRRNYEHSSLTDAIDAVLKGAMGSKLASEVYGIPRSTIGRRLRKAREAERVKAQMAAAVGTPPTQRVVQHVIRVEDLE